jgi:hypothetical protein
VDAVSTRDGYGPHHQALGDSMNSIQAVIICQTNNQRNQVINAVNKYASQHGISTDPVALPYDGNKYGSGPAVIIMAWFADDRADANQAYIDIDSANRNFIQPGSYLLQVDGDTIVHHEVWTSEQGRVVIV